MMIDTQTTEIGVIFHITEEMMNEEEEDMIDIAVEVVAEVTIDINIADMMVTDVVECMIMIGVEIEMNKNNVKQ